MAAKAAVEALLRERKLDRTLTSTLPERLGEDVVASLDSAPLDRGLAGGLPRGQVSEVVGPASSGRTSVAWAALAAATRRGESVALIDTFDRFDPPTAHACGMDLSKLLWVRGQAVSKTSSSNAVAIDPAWLPGVRAVTPGSPSRVLCAMGRSGPGTFIERVIDRAIKSLNLVVQSGVSTLVVIDLIDLPATALRRLPASTWFRVERAIEGSDTAVLILAAQPVARSAGGRSIVLDTGSREPGAGSRQPGAGSREPGAGSRQNHPVPGSRFPVPGVIWRGHHDRSRRLAGVASQASITAARWAHAARVDLSTAVINAV